MPFRWLSKNIAWIWLIVGILVSATVGLLVVTVRQSMAYTRLYSKHSRTMEALDAISSDLKRYRYEVRLEAFKKAAECARTKQAVNAAGRALQKFLKEFPDADTYDRYLRSLPRPVHHKHVPDDASASSK